MASQIDVENVIARFVATSIQDVIATVNRTISVYSTSRTSKQMVAFFESISTGPGQGAAAETHARMAKAMQSSTVRSWGQAKRKLRPAIYAPLRESRYHGGMDRAVNDPELVHSSARGIQFGDVGVLDRDARQWARLNFGAGPRGQGSNERFAVRFSNLPTLEFSFVEAARPGYGLPRGFFKDAPGAGGFGPATAAQGLRSFSSPGGKRVRGAAGGYGSGAFYPTGSSQEFPTRGNIGYRYLDAGIRRFFALLEPEYGKLFRDVLPSSERRGRPPIIGEVRRITSSGSS